MTEEQLNAIEQRANAATPGPWTVIDDDDEMSMQLHGVRTSLWWADTEERNLTPVICATLVQTPKTINHGNEFTRLNWEEDATFIAAARSDVPALVAEVRRLQGVLAECTRWEQTAIDHAGDNQDTILQLRADIERIGRERDGMARANAELQERLSKLQDDLR